MTFLIAQFIGALIATRVLSGALLWVTKNWEGGIARLVFVHLASITAGGVISSLTMLDLTVFQFLSQYLLPQLFWFFFDVICLRNRFKRLQKIAVVSSGLAFLVILIAIISLSTFSSSTERLFLEIEDRFTSRDVQRSNEEINREFATIILNDLHLPFVLDEYTKLTKISPNENFVSLLFETTKTDFHLYNEEKVFWEGFFCKDAQHSRRLNIGAKIAFLYVDPNGVTVDRHIVTAASCKS